MNNIPVFTTQYGVASLILEEIPYKKTAYITIQATQSPEGLLKEAVEFCKACGAQVILAKGHVFLSKYPHHCTIVKMCSLKLPRSAAKRIPVTQDRLKMWQEIYTEKMSKVDNAAYMTDRKAQQMLRDQDGYFVYRDQELLGIGRASGDEIAVVVSCQKGAGEQVVLAMGEVLNGDRVCVHVASTNIPAIRLYTRLGFAKMEEVSRWYRVGKNL